MLKFKTILALIHTILLLGTFAYAATIYDASLRQVEIPPVLLIILGVGVIGVSFWWMLIHIFGGLIMGLMQGGAQEGMSMGFTLGFLMGVGRLWPYIGMWTLAAFIFAKQMILQTTLGVICTLAALALHRMMVYVWKSVEHN